MDEQEKARGETLLGWTNFFISQVDSSLCVESLKGLETGVPLAALLKALFPRHSHQFPHQKIQKKPKGVFAENANLSVCGDFLNQIGFPEPLSRSDFESEEKAKSFIFFLIRSCNQYHVGTVEKVRVFLQDVCAEFDPEIKIKDLSKSFDDGKALCAIMAHMDPDFDYHSSVDGKEPGERIDLVLEHGEKSLGIKNVLTRKQIEEYDDEETILAFISLLVFNVKQIDEKKEQEKEIESKKPEKKREEEEGEREFEKKWAHLLERERKVEELLLVEALQRKREKELSEREREIKEREDSFKEREGEREREMGSLREREEALKKREEALKKREEDLKKREEDFEREMNEREEALKKKKEEEEEREKGREQDRSRDFTFSFEEQEKEKEKEKEESDFFLSPSFCASVLTASFFLLSPPK